MRKILFLWWSLTNYMHHVIKQALSTFPAWVLYWPLSTILPGLLYIPQNTHFNLQQAKEEGEQWRHTLLLSAWGRHIFLQASSVPRSVGRRMKCEENFDWNMFPTPQCDLVLFQTNVRYNGADSLVILLMRKYMESCPPAAWICLQGEEPLFSSSTSQLR